MTSFPWKWRLADLPPAAEDAPTVFSTFACGGGSSMGYKRAGYRVLGCCEIDPGINAVYKANLKPKHNYVMDLREFNSLEDLPDDLYSLDVLDGSPPCSVFSMAGDRDAGWGVEKRFAEGQALQKLDDLFFVFLDTAAKLRPKVIVAENVTGLLRGKSRGFVNEIVRKFASIGYEVQLFVLDASAMECPQKRERVFFIGNRCGFPKLRLSFAYDPVTFGEVRTKRGSQWANPDCLTARRLKRARSSDNSIGDIAERTEGRSSDYCSMIFHDEKPASTLTATGSAYRLFDRMPISKEDARNIQTFPQDYDFGDKTTLSGVKFICGMSVPPSMMAHIAHEIKAQWLGKE